MESKHPDLIRLRLPASLLSSLKDAERITIRHSNNEALEHKSSLSISQSDQTEEHILHTDECTHVDWYQASNQSSRQKVFTRMGTSCNQYTVTKQKPKLDTSTSNIKRIGAQTRKLLEDERKKRKEIVRLEDDELPLPPEAHCKEKSDGGTNEKNTQKKMAKPKLQLKQRKRKRHDPSIDSSAPNTEHLISAAITKNDRSDVIRLHGLPVGVKVGDIRKFFHGLDPTVFVLPTFHGFIKRWDGQVTTGKSVVKRYPETFRVYAKFKSVFVADAAMGRLGESIGLDIELNGCVGAEISLSPVSKLDASFLLKYLAISTRKGELISETMSAVERRIGTVSNLVWIMAAKKLKLGLNFSSSLHKIFHQRTSISKDTSQYNALVKVYNQLIDEHDKIERETNLLMMHTFDPSCLSDSAHRIVQSVSNWLLDELSIIERNLCVARQAIKEAPCCRSSEEADGNGDGDLFHL